MKGERYTKENHFFPLIFYVSFHLLDNLKEFSLILFIEIYAAPEDVL